MKEEDSRRKEKKTNEIEGWGDEIVRGAEDRRKKRKNQKKEDSRRRRRDQRKWRENGYSVIFNKSRTRA